MMLSRSSFKERSGSIEKHRSSLKRMMTKKLSSFGGAKDRPTVKRLVSFMLQKKLIEKSVVPSDNLQKKLDYYFTPYNRTLANNKFMTFDKETDREWTDLTQFILHENKEVFRQSLKSINNGLYLELGLINQAIKKKKVRRRKIAKQAKERGSGSPDKFFESKATLFPGRKSKFANLKLSQEDFRSPQQTDSLNSVSEMEDDSEFSDSDSVNSSKEGSKKPVEIDDLLDELRNQKELDMKEGNGKKKSFQSFLESMFHFKKPSNKRNKFKKRKVGSIFVAPATPTIPSLEPVRVHSTLATRNYQRLGTSKNIQEEISVPKEFRKLHTSLGAEKPQRKTVYPEIMMKTSQNSCKKPLPSPVICRGLKANMIRKESMILKLKEKNRCFQASQSPEMKSIIPNLHKSTRPVKFTFNTNPCTPTANSDLKFLDMREKADFNFRYSQKECGGPTNLTNEGRVKRKRARPKNSKKVSWKLSLTNFAESGNVNTESMNVKARPPMVRVSNTQVSTACETTKVPLTPISAIPESKFSCRKHGRVGTKLRSKNRKSRLDSSLWERSIALDEIDDFRNLSVSS